MATINGGSGNDSLNGLIWNDTINAYGGADTVNAGDGNDLTYGGDGADSLSGGNGSDTQYGDAGNDTISDGSGADISYGGTGNDVLYGDDGSGDYLYGDADQDTIYGGASSGDYVAGGAGSDLIYAGAGDDTGAGGSDGDTVYGDAGNDGLWGENGADRVFGGAGMDQLYGGQGSDTLDGGDDADGLRGGAGADSLIGGAGSDTLHGDVINVTPSASTGSATITGTVVNNAGFGIDLYWVDYGGALVYQGTIATGASYSAPIGTAWNFVLYEAGTNVQLASFSGSEPGGTYTYDANLNDTLEGGAGADQVFGEYGNDLLYGGIENDSVYGGVGADSAYGGDGADYVDLGEGDDSFGGFADEGGNDTIHGAGGHDFIISGSGDDIIHGGTGNDSMSAGEGSDSMYGGAGADQFYVTDDHGFDLIDGGEDSGDHDALYFGNWLTAQGVTVTYTGGGAGSYDFIGSAGYGSFTGLEAVGGTDYADFLNADADGAGTILYGSGGDDTVYGGAGADALFGDEGHDNILTKGGADTVYGGDGNDVIDDTANAGLIGPVLAYGGAGNDTLWTGNGNDTVQGDDGNDLIAGEGGNDSIFGGAGADAAWGDAGADTLAGDDGDDALFGGSENDMLYGGGGADTLQGGGGNDLMDGGADADLIQVDQGSGVDTVLGGEAGQDSDVLQFSGSTAGVTVTYTGQEAGSYAFAGGSGSFGQIEQVQGTDFADSIDASVAGGGVAMDGGQGDDILRGGAGSDIVQGGSGHDLLTGGQGNDSLTGGADNDTFQVETAGGHDLITDFNMAVVDGKTIDQLDISDLLNAEGAPVNAWDIVVGDDGNGNAVLTFPSGEEVTLTGVAPQDVSTAKQMKTMGIPCFAAGTMIDTPQGARVIEALRAGDMVCTRDQGVQPVLWAGKRVLRAGDLDARPDLRPVLIAAGALGNRTDLVVSPQHALLIAGGRFVRARHLALRGEGRFRVLRGCRGISYHHIMLPRHAVIFANGGAAETFYPGRMAFCALNPRARAEILLMFPGLGAVIAGRLPVEAVYGPMAAPMLTRRQVTALCQIGAPEPSGHQNHPSEIFCLFG